MLKTPLPIKAIIREWRTSELAILFIALIIAVSCVSAMNQFTSMVKQQMEQSAANLLGADAALSSNQSINPEWRQKASAFGLEQTENITFLSMVDYQNQLQLAQIKAITTPYPLRGSLKIATQSDDLQGKEINHAPKRGTVWLDAKLLPLLATEIGKIIHIGDGDFKITGIIREEPGQTGNWFTLSPRILMNQEDVAKTKVIQPGSKVTYNWLLNGSTSQLKQLQEYLQNKISEQQQWLDSQTNTNTISTTIERTLNYLNFSSLISLILAGVAISMASLRYCQRNLKQVALLRCFGASQEQVMKLYLSSITMLGIIACIIGSLLGYFLQPLLIKWLGELVPDTKQHFSIGPFFLSWASGMMLLFCFSIGNIWQLRKISAIALFRQQHLLWRNSSFVTYGLALLLLTLMAYAYTHSLQITLGVLIGCVAFVGLALSGLWVLFSLLIKSKIYIPLNWRLGFNNIARNFENSALQVIGIGLALTAILSLMLLKNHLISDWQRQLPADTANYFLINIEPEQTPVLKTLLANNHINSAEFFPMVRGRLTAINSVDVNKKFGQDVKNINALQRELNLSWSEQLPQSNKITAGSWSITDPKLAWVSVDKGLAERLGLKIGDTIRFHIEDSDQEVQITSFREIDWNSFRPNFFMLFKPGLLNDLPTTMITSFYLPSSQQSLLLRITKQFPNVTLIDIANTLTKVRSILTSASNAISFISFFALLTGLLIVSLAILSFSGAKLQETQTLKILGMRRRTLLWIRSSEALMLGSYSGLLAIGSAIFINMYTAAIVLDSQFSIPWSLLFIVPLATALLTMAINFFIQRKHYQERITSAL